MAPPPAHPFNHVHDSSCCVVCVPSFTRATWPLTIRLLEFRCQATRRLRYTWTWRKWLRQNPRIHRHGRVSANVQSFIRKICNSGMHTCLVLLNEDHLWSRSASCMFSLIGAVSHCARPPDVSMPNDRPQMRLHSTAWLGDLHSTAFPVAPAQQSFHPPCDSPTKVMLFSHFCSILT